ncbi:class I SAM-dependent methyltransferase [Clostridium oryzae]|uniref:Malonyl-[acyl-carrier protein] O-methyltransferase n=1 Tax=Clostridium oryzae TaxID=1450648 RepID=A0A1V4IQ37_9CLOT|nr:class I SAM-dependent methyltransferase [Clostridium oryzae]OPJ62138.1 malonyl-[acyl-carrier protein] O-methyltransferase [Clostridium oryzae]
MSSVNYFDSIADKWNVIRSEYFEEKLKYAITSKVQVVDKICADLGCGTGFVSLELSEKAKLVFSLDRSRNMLKELNNASQKLGRKNIYPITGSMEEIPLFDNSMDAVFTNMALHHVEKPDKAIKEMYRILNTDGIVVISDVKKHNGYWAIEEMHDVWLGFSDKQITDWLSEAGFSNIQIHKTDLSCKGYSSKGEYTETGIFIATGIKR